MEAEAPACDHVLKRRRAGHDVEIFQQTSRAARSTDAVQGEGTDQRPVVTPLEATSKIVDSEEEVFDALNVGELKGRNSGSCSLRLERGEANVASFYVINLVDRERNAIKKIEIYIRILISSAFPNSLVN